MTQTYMMNKSGSSIGGWNKSEMRSYLNSEIYNSLSNEVKAVIKTVYKLSDDGISAFNDINHTEDNLFLLSTDEVGLENMPYHIKGQGTKYEYFNNNTSRIKTKLDNSLSWWWLRSTDTYDDNCIYDFGAVYVDGRYGASNVYGENGIVFAFCI